MYLYYLFFFCTLKPNNVLFIPFKAFKLYRIEYFWKRICAKKLHWYINISEEYYILYFNVHILFSIIVLFQWNISFGFLKCNNLIHLKIHSRVFFTIKNNFLNVPLRFITWLLTMYYKPIFPTKGFKTRLIDHIKDYFEVMTYHRYFNA